MDTISAILPVVGIACCALAVCQLALWTATSLSHFNFQRREFQHRQSEFRGQLTQARAVSNRLSPALVGRWQGFRQFRVDRIETEAHQIRSVYLIPEDGKPIAHFQPGQYLTFRFQIPGEAKPVVRCYSLSNGPGQSFYRITVKEVPAPRELPELKAGKASLYINRELRVGQQVDVKAPAGEFCLQEDSEKPVVLLAGGIGITPMISMIERLIKLSSNRLVLLVYGVNQGNDHAFKTYLADVAKHQANFHLLTCYSQPGTPDRLGIDHHFVGRVSADLLTSVLPNLDCEFYLCGPPSFMKSIYDGLVDQGVDKNNIRYEAFGPASIGTIESQAAAEHFDTAAVPIKFSKSQVIANWDGSKSSLLEFAESNDVAIDAGCRAGSCGACCTAILSGSVEYPAGQIPDCPTGHCLMCVARPLGPLELGA